MEFPRTKAVLEKFRDNFKCDNCKQLGEEYILSESCSHFFCKKCVSKKTFKCPECYVLVQTNEMQANFVVNNLVTVLKLSDAIWQDDENNEVNSAEEGSNISKKLAVNLNKRNHKGETELHAACLKENAVKVKDLLDADANPNTKDNFENTPLLESSTAGSSEICEILLKYGAVPNTKNREKSTPLFEAVNRCPTPPTDVRCPTTPTDVRYYDICEMLLKNGALPNMHSVLNKTALHKAVEKDLCKQVKLLLRFGADKTSLDYDGKIPKDYCTSDAMRAILSSVNISSNSWNTFIAYPMLTRKKSNELKTAAAKHNLGIETSYSNKVTFVIVEDESADFTYEMCLPILHGKWILSFDWVRQGLTADKISDIDLEKFELQRVGNSIGTPAKARRNAEMLKPGLFSSCYFYFSFSQRRRSTFSIGKLKLTKENLEALAKEGEGNILDDEPTLEFASENRYFPFHVSGDATHPLHKCAYFIIYEKQRDLPVRHDSEYLKSLPLIWFMECIENFTLMNPSKYDLQAT